MSQRPYSFLVIFLLAFLGHISAQVKVESDRGHSTMPCPGKTAYFDMGRMKELQSKIKPEDNIRPAVNYNTLFNFNFDVQLRLDYKGPDSIKKVMPEPLISLSRSILDPAYYSQHLGFFCQKEIQLQKITTVPVRLRLGSLDYVNYLEQKPNAIKPR